ncbi:hypothetical protein K2O51_23355 [Cupriavidus pinatubonensis]|uniref:hypothetical protein n=1 Tax=Cupriavidus pinatubonensis TaxID=248026 RepID=UPI001C72AD1F|nr:hypothetical protein [Cupriavidus pinatubonensis]QYY30310.1 hypothetical protein K2O51_23355 [Cupriavidus pinatubonensis]
MLAGEDLDAFVEDFGDPVTVASRGIASQLAVIEQGWKDVINGIVRGLSFTLTGRADVFGQLVGTDLVVVEGGYAAGNYHPFGAPMPIDDGAFVAVELNKVAT